MELKGSHALHQLQLQHIDTSCVEDVTLVRHVSTSRHKNE